MIRRFGKPSTPIEVLKFSIKSKEFSNDNKLQPSGRRKLWSFILFEVLSGKESVLEVCLFSLKEGDNECEDEVMDEDVDAEADADVDNENDDKLFGVLQWLLFLENSNAFGDLKKVVEVADEPADKEDFKSRFILGLSKESFSWCSVNWFSLIG